jgi:hypothetical protein
MNFLHFTVLEKRYAQEIFRKQQSARAGKKAQARLLAIVLKLY